MLDLWCFDLRMRSLKLTPWKCANFAVTIGIFRISAGNTNFIRKVGRLFSALTSRSVLDRLRLWVRLRLIWVNGFANYEATSHECGRIPVLWHHLSSLYHMYTADSNCRQSTDTKATAFYVCDGCVIGGNMPVDIQYGGRDEWRLLWRFQ